MNVARTIASCIIRRYLRFVSMCNDRAAMFSFILYVFLLVTNACCSPFVIYFVSSSLFKWVCICRSAVARMQTVMIHIYFLSVEIVSLSVCDTTQWGRWTKPNAQPLRHRPSVCAHMRSEYIWIIQLCIRVLFPCFKCNLYYYYCHMNT